LLNVEASPENSAMNYCQGTDEGANEQSLTYAELDRAARRRAAWLQHRYRPGDRALLLHPPGLEFVRAFLGCLYAGVVPVPAPPPTADKRQVDRTMGIARDADVSIVLSTSGLAETLRGQLADAQAPDQLSVVSTDHDATADAGAWTMPRLAPDSIAFLQYTSGSTSEPKGVMVTQRSLAANASAIQRQGATGRDDVMVAWLPHFHDMGLIGVLLHSLYTGGNAAFMAPTAFLKRPVEWLKAIDQFRGTMTAAPDFAYDLCARVVTSEQMAGLDLSSLRWAMNGSEPVRARTLDRFIRTFEPVGFRPEAFSPCYGMAEFTLMATISRPGVPPTRYSADPRGLERHEVGPATGERATPLVGCGRVDVDSLNLRIVDPGSLIVLEPGQVGEVWLKGESVAAGYWRQPDITAQVFQAYTAGGQGPYLRTGDLGTMLDGELYITGRLKDVLIVHGRNIYPQDIEYLVREIHPALAAGAGAVFAVSDDEREHIVIVQEVKKGLLDGVGADELTARIRVAVTKSLDVPAPSVVLTNRGAVQRTTSGKVQRRLMRTLFLENRLKTLREELSASVQTIRSRATAQAEYAAASRVD
jgi:acyl-CoA synthetase (AMP-forming)/AMP-acid ligase II